MHGVLSRYTLLHEDPHSVTRGISAKAVVDIPAHGSGHGRSSHLGRHLLDDVGLTTGAFTLRQVAKHGPSMGTWQNMISGNPIRYRPAVLRRAYLTLRLLGANTTEERFYAAQRADEEELIGYPTLQKDIITADDVIEMSAGFTQDDLDRIALELANMASHDAQARLVERFIARLFPK